MKKILLGISMLSILGGLAGCAAEDEVSQTTGSLENSSSSSTELPQNTLFIVGDSTLCSFSDKYYYPRYGYGTQIANYLSNAITVNNLAMSGRSSKSFIMEENYETLKTTLKSGDYLLIGFGHNDEKSDDSTRYTNPTGGIEDQTSFQYFLYNYYIKVAKDVGATPILATPIVRADASNNYDGASGHITATGNYAQCIRDLGASQNIDVLDLTAATKSLYLEQGYNEALYYHAMTTSNVLTLDTTHLNIYGAKMVAYLTALALKESSSTLGSYVLESITAPTRDVDLVPNPDYVETGYTPFDQQTYTPQTWTNFTTAGWYGTAFGDTGGNPTAASNGYTAEETNSGVFKVGQTGTTSGKGKFSTSSDGFAMIFRQVDKTKNFTITASAKVLTSKDGKQSGFGLMLRDDIYVEQSSANPGILSNYVAAGIYNTSDTAASVLFKRENAKLTNEGNALSSIYSVNDITEMTITRVGQTITTTVVYKGQTYTKSYYDFDLVAIDNSYFYIGMFANRGTTVEFTNVDFQITGDAVEA